MGSIGIDAEWDVGYGTYGGVLCDKVDIYLTDIIGAQAPYTVQSIKAMNWATNQGQFYVYTGAATAVPFKLRTTVLLTGTGYQNQFSVVNFSAYSGTFGRETGTTGNWSNIIRGTWIKTDASENWVPAPVGEGSDNDGEGVPENLICSLLVKSGTIGHTITFGDGTANSQFGYSSAGVVTTQFSVERVPEPSTLALLGCGLFGLLAYAWRKRK